MGSLFWLVLPLLGCVADGGSFSYSYSYATMDSEEFPCWSGTRADDGDDNAYWTCDEVFAPGKYTPDAANWQLKQAAKAWCIDPSSAAAVYGPINDWDVSRVTEMSYLFSYCTYSGSCLDSCFWFDEDLNSWDTSRVTSMYRMLMGVPYFNGNISAWDVSRVVDWDGFLSGADSFDQKLCWDTEEFAEIPDALGEHLDCQCDGYTEKINRCYPTMMPVYPTMMPVHMPTWPLLSAARAAPKTSSLVAVLALVGATFVTLL
jgi:hypothetical protein